jgi:integrase
MARPKGIVAEELSAIRGDYDPDKWARAPFSAARNYILFEFLLDTGLRADEVRLLRYGQLDEGREWIRNVRTKGRRFRNVYITSNMRPLLNTYLARREVELKRFYTVIPANLVDLLPVFISTYRCDPTQPESFLMGSKTLWRAIRTFSKEHMLHPHLLRHSYALDLLDSAHDIRLVAQALGHSDVRVTMRYTERQEEEVARALEHSRNAKK